MTAWLAIVSAITSGTAAFLEFGTFPLDARQFIVTASGGVTLVAAAAQLKAWCVGDIGAWFESNRRQLFGRFIIGRLIISVLGLGAIVAGTSLLFILSTTYHSLRLDLVPVNKQTFVILHAAKPNAASVTVEYPARPATDCRPFDPEPDHGAQAALVGPEGANPQLVLTNFADPQVIALSCDPPIRPDQVRVFVPQPNLQTVRRADVARLHWLAIVAGGAAWLACGLAFITWCLLSS